MALLCQREDILRLDHNQKDYYLKRNELIKSHEKLNLQEGDTRRQDTSKTALLSWLGDTLGALVGDADGSQLGTALGIQDGW